VKKSYLDIAIDRDRAISESEEKKKAMLRHARSRRYTTKRGGQIRFFDTGQIFDDRWIDIPYSLETGVAITIVNLPDSPVAQFNFEDYSLDSWYTLYSALMMIDLKDWADTYREIEFSESRKYGIGVFNGNRDYARPDFSVTALSYDSDLMLSPNNTDWSDSGLQPHDADIAVKPTGGLALWFSTYDTDKFKVTLEFDYNADAVNIDVSRGANVFLIPNIIFPWAFQEDGQDTTFTRCAYWCFWRTKSRELFLEKTMNEWFTTHIEIPIFQGYSGADFWHSNDTSLTFPGYEDRCGISFRDEMRAYLLASPDAKAYVQRGTNASGGASFGYEDKSVYPLGSLGLLVDGGFGFRGSINTTFGVATTVGNRYNGAGMLRAVIEVGSDFYYVWSKVDTDEFYDALGIDAPDFWDGV